MNKNKSLLALAVALAVGSTSAMASTKDDSKSVKANNTVQNVANTMVVNQTSETGAAFGNDLVALQEGDLNYLKTETQGARTARKPRRWALLISCY
ncbi:hypothetical protein [Pseudoalteromonas sp. T1lg24]|uniref:hypothetical protein n=1 Tax=Pseudoalteromonas sp. T1lg24 TaxID=2077099 RepID=UPI001F3BE5F0|nr:hypothetical protein [Pseudoalteromonas sp. T1lg24]